jgi:hypothetical protein
MIAPGLIAERERDAGDGGEQDHDTGRLESGEQRPPSVAAETDRMRETVGIE